MAVKDLLIKLGLKGDKKAVKGIKKVDKSFVSMAKSAMKIGGIFYAAKGIIEGLRQIAEIGGRTEAVSNSFNSLAEKAGFAGDTLGKLQQATDGTVSSLDLMTQANNAMLLGIFESDDQMAKMFDTAQRLSSALGQDTLFGVESLVTGLGRQSKLMLDNLGIMVDMNKAYENYAKELGKTADSLTDAEKKQAFTNEALRQADELVASLGEEQLTTADKMDMMKSSVVNMAGSLSQVLEPAFDGSLDLMTEFTKKTEKAMEGLAKLDIGATFSNMINNFDLLIDTFVADLKLRLDGMPELFKFAFEKIFPILKNIFFKMVEIAEELANFIWEPIPIMAKVMAGKVQNIFINMFNALKEQFNDFTETWVGDKLGIEKLGLTDLVDTEEIAAGMQDTGVFDFFFGDNEVQTLADYTEKSTALWTAYFEQVAVAKSDADMQGLESTIENNEALLALQQDFSQRSLTIEQAAHQEAIKSIMKKAQAYRDANVSEAEVQKFVTEEKRKLNLQEQNFEVEKTQMTIGLIGKAAEARGADAQALKGIAVYEAILSTYQSAAKAFARFGGFPGGIAPAAASVAFGLAQVAQITGAKFAEGGIVPGIDTGQGDTVPAMLTPGELILNQAQQDNLAGGMGGVTINFSGPVTNDEYVKDFIIPEIEKTISQNLA